MPFPEGRLLRLPGDLLLRVELHLEDISPGRPLEDHLAQLIADWLAADRARLAALQAASCRRGYQWKDVFLVDRTLLRTVVQGTSHIAEVRNDDVVFNERTTTPSQFANGFGIAHRNAWECVWILAPGRAEWTKASKLRGAVSSRSSKAL